MKQATNTLDTMLESLSPLGDTDPVCAAQLEQHLERALEAVDRLHEAARVTPEDLRLHVTM